VAEPDAIVGGIDAGDAECIDGAGLVETLGIGAEGRDAGELWVEEDVAR
jgi:hypothetical protein